MNTNLKRRLTDATRLTRAGDLAAATRAIRDALEGRAGAASVPGDGGGTVIDGECRVHRERDARGGTPDGMRHGRDRRAGASGGTRGPGGIDERASVRPGRARGASARAETAGDGGASGSSGITGVSRARHVGRSRALEYRLFVPPLAPGAPAPALVVMLHGCTQDADDFAVGTGMDALAREHGFLVLYPEQSGRANPQRCWNWFKDTHQRRGQGEPALIEGAVREVIAAHGVDGNRVFVAGLSAGGAMAAILGDVCPELFRAVGVHSGLAAGAARDMPGALAAMRGGQGTEAPASAGDRSSARRPPTIVFHGDADRTVHPDNGERVVAASLGAARHASGSAPTVERRRGRDGGRDWTREVHAAPGGDVVAEHWRVHGAAHAWSGGDARGSWTDATGPDASAEMVRFFLAAGAR